MTWNEKLAIPISALLIGCVDPSIPVGVRCGAAGSCPGGQACEVLSQTCRPEGALRSELPVGVFGSRPDPVKTPLIRIARGSPAPNVKGYVLIANDAYLRLTWAGYSEFRGSIYPQTPSGGRVEVGCSDGGCLAEPGTTQVQQSSDGLRIDFVSFPIGQQRGGLTFIFPQSEVLYFDLLVDSSYRPDLTYLIEARDSTGPSAINAPAVPFAITD